MNTRLERLTDHEKVEVQSIIENLENINNEKVDFVRFGQLMEKADGYDLLPHSNEVIENSSEIYSKIWPEANALRKSGELLALGKKITCPVIAIHGCHDPHPYEGVEKPLSSVLSDFKFILLDKCGHKPWIEKYAKDNFYSILKKILNCK